MPDQGQVTTEEFQRRVGVYEATTEGLAKVAGLIGRWGNTAQVAIVSEAIDALWRYANDNRSGVVVFLKLRSYPAVLVFHAVRLGLEAARNWVELHRIFNEPLDTDGYTAMRVIDGVSHLTWEGGRRDLWNMMPELDRRYTPLADHFADNVFKRWAPAFLPPRADLETASLFDEALTAIAYIEQAEFPQLRQALDRDDGRDYISIPVGRAGWDTRNFENRIGPLLNEDFAANLAEAGFGQGKAEFVKAAITNHAKNCAARSWW